VNDEDMKILIYFFQQNAEQNPISLLFFQKLQTVKDLEYSKRGALLDIFL